MPLRMAARAAALDMFELHGDVGDSEVAAQAILDPFEYVFAV